MQKQQKQKQKRLGRGLSSLISVESPVVGKPAAADELVPASGPAGVIRVTEIQPNPFQPRKVMAPEELQALADSIKASGLIQPVIVRASGDNAYHLIAGERRWRASQMAGLSEIPAVVRDATDEQMLEIALAENIFREDLNAIDRATAYRRYCDEFSLSAEQVAQRLGEDRTTVTNYLRLLDLPEEVKQWVADGKLAMGHARCLLAIPSPSDLIRTAKQTDAIKSARAVMSPAFLLDRLRVIPPAPGSDQARSWIRVQVSADLRQLLAAKAGALG